MPARPRPPRRSARPGCEQLEGRLVPAFFLVNDPSPLRARDALTDPTATTATGTVTLQSVFDRLNVVGGDHVIGFSGPMTARIARGLVTSLTYARGSLDIHGIRDASGLRVKIDGELYLHGPNNVLTDLAITGRNGTALTLRGDGNTVSASALASRLDAAAGVELRGSGNQLFDNRLGLADDGVTPLGGHGVIVAGNNNDVGLPSLGNVIAGRVAGAWVQGSGNRVVGNTIGQAAAPVPVGVLIGGIGNSLGGDQPADRNHVTGSLDAVRLSGRGHVVRGNYVGLAGDGTTHLGNTNGIAVSGTGHTIGVTAAGITSGRWQQERNVIVGGTGGAAVLFHVGAANNRVAGNHIGTTADGLAPAGTAAYGVLTRAANTIGGTGEEERNIIRGATAGVLIANVGGSRVQGNWVGVGPDGSTALGGEYGVRVATGGNLIGGNVIAGTTAAAVRVTGDGNTLTANRIGLEADGVGTVGEQAGVLVQGNNNLIGGLTEAERNFIVSAGPTGNAVEITGTGNRVRGNRIGLADDDATAAGAFVGVKVTGNGNFIGDPAGPFNVIVGCRAAGVDIAGDGNRVRNNLVGVLPDGRTARGNRDGVIITGVGNVVGGAAAAERNVLSGNRYSDNGVDFLGTGLVLRLPTTRRTGGNVVVGNHIGVSADGTEAVPNQHGAAVDGVNNRLGGLRLGEENVIYAPGHAVHLGAAVTPLGSSGNAILGNLIGTTPDGNALLGPAGSSPNQSAGLYLDGSRPLTNTVVRGNVIADCQTGIVVVRPPMTGSTAGTLVAGNRIGVGLDGETPLPNTDGVLLDAARGVTIGGATEADRNVLSANADVGVRLVNNASGNTILGNYLGTNAGAADLGNGLHAIHVEHGSNNVIGTRLGAAVRTARRNVIAYNGGRADVPSGQRGHAVQIDAGTGNTVRGNRFRGNAGLSIYLTDPARPNELPQNDVGLFDDSDQHFADSDAGPNGLQNVPVLRSAVPGQTMTWQINGRAFARYTLDFYVDAGAPFQGTGHGEGEFFVRTVAVTTDRYGHAEVTVPWSGRLSATATDAAGNTSPLSLIDADADGLADAWEEHGWGIDLDLDGVVDQALPDADPGRKDVYLEVDVMGGAVDAALDVDAVFARVAEAFARAPRSVGNLAGRGVGLHINPDVPATAVPADPLLDDLWADVAAIRAAHFGGGTDVQTRARAMAFRYGLLAQDFVSPQTGVGGHSGAAHATTLGDPAGAGTSLALGGDGFVVAMPASFFAGAATGTEATELDLAGTLMRNLGHTLGLPVGGVDHVAFKPNYVSVMNPLWQVPDALFRGGDAEGSYAGGWELDYSRAALPSLNEKALSEPLTELRGDPDRLVPVNTVFLNPATGGLMAADPAHPWQVIPQAGKDPRPPASGRFIDWRRNGVLDGGTVAVDLNNDGRLTVLRGADDWSRLVFNFRESPSYGGAGFTVVNELSRASVTAGPPPASDVVVVGADAGSEPRVQTINPDGTVGLDFLAFDASFRGGVRVAKGDLDGDQVPDVIAAMGPGGGTVSAFHGVTGVLLWSVTPYGAGFIGGVNVAAAETGADGLVEVFVGPASGVGSEVLVLAPEDGSEVVGFVAFTAATRGGVTVAAGDVNGDGKADVIVGKASGASPAVRAFDALGGPRLLSFAVASPAFNGVFVAAADVDGDGKADVIVGAGAGTASATQPLVRVYSGATPGQVLFTLQADDAGFRGGVRVGAVRMSDGTVDVVIGTGAGKRFVRRFGTGGVELHYEAEALGPGFSGVFVA